VSGYLHGGSKIAEFAGGDALAAEGGGDAAGARFLNHDFDIPFWNGKRLKLFDEF